MNVTPFIRYRQVINLFDIRVNTSTAFSSYHSKDMEPFSIIFILPITLYCYCRVTSTFFRLYTVIIEFMSAVCALVFFFLVNHTFAHVYFWVNNMFVWYIYIYIFEKMIYLRMYIFDEHAQTVVLC